MTLKNEYLAVVFYHPEVGREKEFIKIWQEGPVKLAEELGARQISIYFRPETNDYMCTAHWPDVDTFLSHLNSPKLRPWLDKINDISREPSAHEFFRIVEERAA